MAHKLDPLGTKIKGFAMEPNNAKVVLSHDHDGVAPFPCQQCLAMIVEAEKRGVNLIMEETGNARDGYEYHAIGLTG